VAMAPIDRGRCKDQRWQHTSALGNVVMVTLRFTKGGADVNSGTMMATHLYTVHAMRVTPEIYRSRHHDARPTMHDTSALGM
jgi:hypothetical protein